MIATPAVACGMKTLHSPSPRGKQNARTDSVKSTIRRRAVSTSSTSVFISSAYVFAHCHADLSGGRCWVNRWRHRGAAPRGKGWIVYARSTTIQAQPSSIDAGVAHIRDAVMPRLQEVDGCVGLSLLADKQTGRCIVTTAWETEDAMQASVEPTRPMREEAAETFGGIGSPMVEEWEIVVLHRDHSSGDGACARATWVQLPPDQLEQGIDF